MGGGLDVDLFCTFQYYCYYDVVCDDMAAMDCDSWLFELEIFSGSLSVGLAVVGGSWMDSLIESVFTLVLLL